MNRRIKSFFTLGIILLTVFHISGCNFFRKTNQGQVNLQWYMKLTDDNEQSYTIEGEGFMAAVVLENGYDSHFAIVRDDEVFLNIDTIQEHLDRRFYFANNDQKVLFTNATNIYETELLSRRVNDEEVDYMTCFRDGDQCYINLLFVRRFIDFDYKLLKADAQTPERVFLTYSTGEKIQMKVSDNIELRSGADYQNLIVTTVVKNSMVTVVEDAGLWKKVRTPDGYIGYLPKSELMDEKKEVCDFQNDADTYTHTLLGKKVSLVWNQVTNPEANYNMSGLLSNVDGLNVISPTWFTLKNKEGSIHSLASKSYVEKVNQLGLQVWALFSDLGGNNSDVTYVLSYEKARRTMIQELISQVDSYGINGINIDFENITEDLADDYMQFLRELSIECRSRKIILSIDNYAPTTANRYYDREQQSQLADYIIVMSYDEHATSADGAGSVSSMAFTKQAIEDTIEEVGDAGRVLNGMPFYTTVWTKTPPKYSDGSGTFYEDPQNGDYYLTSQDVTMDTATRCYRAAGAKPSYDENSGQNFVSYEKGKTSSLIWLEDAMSVKKRLDFMEEYHLGGAAYWSLGQETDDIWNVIQDYFNE